MICFGEDQVGQDEEQHDQKGHRSGGTRVEAEGVGELEWKLREWGN